MKITHDFFLVKVDSILEPKIGFLDAPVFTQDQSGEDNEISYSFNKNKRIYGTVLSVPDKLTPQIIGIQDEGFPEHQRGIGHEELQAMGARSWPESKVKRYYYPSHFEATQITIQKYTSDLSNIDKGDRVYFNYIATCEEAEVEPGVYKIRIDDLIAVVKPDGEIKGIAGWVLVTPDLVTEAETITASGIITQVGDKPKYLIGNVVVGYGEVKAGWKIYYLPNSDWCKTIEGNEYYLMKEDDIIARIE